MPEMCAVVELAIAISICWYRKTINKKNRKEQRKNEEIAYSSSATTALPFEWMFRIFLLLRDATLSWEDIVLRSFRSEKHHSNVPFMGFLKEKEKNQTVMQSNKVAKVADKKDTMVAQMPKCYLRYFIKDAKKVFKADDLGREIATIAFPAFIALTAEPLASLVDTAFIGKLGPVDLAAVGVSIAVFNLISKLLNYPLLNLTTSLVAEEDARKPDNVEVEMGVTPDKNDTFISDKEKNDTVMSDKEKNDTVISDQSDTVISDKEKNDTVISDQSDRVLSDNDKNNALLSDKADERECIFGSENISVDHDSESSGVQVSPDNKDGIISSKASEESSICTASDAAKEDAIEPDNIISQAEVEIGITQDKNDRFSSYNGNNISCEEKSTSTAKLMAEEKATETDNGVAHVMIDVQIMPDKKDVIISEEAAEEKSITSTSNRQVRGGGGKRNLPSVSTAIIVGSALGVLELAILILGCGIILNAMGVPPDSDMRGPAKKYLKLRATGCPAVVVSLASQGVFRGFKDTRTPLFATATGNVVNIILVPIFMFPLGLGVGGSAIATVISQYLIALILIVKLNKLVVLFTSKLGELRLWQFFKNGGLLLVRSAAAMLSLTLATSEAARLGAIPMAAHQICTQIWLATSLLSDAIALAGQAIIASAIAKSNYELTKRAAFRTVQMGFAFGVILSVILGVGMGTFSKIFTRDPAVHRFLALGIPFVAATQPVNAVAFVFDGLHFGASDYTYAAYSMIIVAIIGSGVLVGTTIAWKFIGVWVGLSVLMTLRMLTGFLRVGTASGPWAFLR